MPFSFRLFPDVRKYQPYSDTSVKMWSQFAVKKQNLGEKKQNKNM